MTIRYLMISIGFICVCLAMWMLPAPRQLQPDRLGLSPTADTVDLRVIGARQRKGIAFTLGIAASMHILTAMIGIHGIFKWAVAIVVPTVGLVAWCLFRDYYLDHHPGALNSFNLTGTGLVIFSIGFVIVTALFSPWAPNRSNTPGNDNVADACESDDDTEGA